MSFDVEVTIGGKKRRASLQAIKVGATADHMLLAFGAEDGAELVVEVAIPVASGSAARFADGVAAAAAVQSPPPGVPLQARRNFGGLEGGGS